MRILINGSYAPSLITFRGRLIETLIARGHVVHVSAPDFPSDTRSALVALGVVVHEIRLGRNKQNPFGDLTYFYDLVRAMLRAKPQFVLNYTVKPNIWGSLAARFCNIKSASMVTGLGFSFGPANGARMRLVQLFARRLYALATRANTAVVFQNPDDIRDFIAAGCLSNADKAVMVNGSGVDMAHYALTPLPPQPIFLMISRFLVSKGLREYAQAAIQILQVRNDCRFMLVGFPDEGVDGIALSEMEGWRHAGIEFCGQMADVRPAIAQASVYVLPSYREGTPRTVLEAMAMGRPIITTDAPGCRETVDEGRNGLKVAVADSGELARAMGMMADDAEMRTAMGLQSRQIAENKYAVDKVNAQLIKLLAL